MVRFQPVGSSVWTSAEPVMEFACLAAGVGFDAGEGVGEYEEIGFSVISTWHQGLI